jgi:hypothetical protein
MNKLEFLQKTVTRTFPVFMHPFASVKYTWYRVSNFGPASGFGQLAQLNPEDGDHIQLIVFGVNVAGMVTGKPF